MKKSKAPTLVVAGVVAVLLFLLYRGQAGDDRAPPSATAAGAQGRER